MAIYLRQKKQVSYFLIPGLLQNRSYSKRRLTMEEIAEGVAMKEDITVSMMRFKTRKRPIVQARQ